MNRSRGGSRAARTFLAGAVLALSIPVVAEAAALTGPERKAVEIKRVDGATTDAAALVEIDFKGKIEDELGTGGLKKARVTIELIGASGPTTVITDQKASRKPKEGRSGTQGRFDVIRDGRGMLLLVEGLPGPADQVVVTTSGPAGKRSRVGRRGDVEGEEYDELAKELPWINNDERADFADQRAGEKLDQAEADLDKAERETDKTIDAIDRAQRDVATANTGAQAHEARLRLEKLKEKREELIQRRKTLRAKIKALERWRRAIFNVRSGGTQRQCNDGGDNGDPEDTLADHPADPGCVDALDNDEKDSSANATCPAEGVVNAVTRIDLFTPATNSIIGGRVTNAAGGTIVQPQGPGPEGPTALANSLCGSGTTTTFRYGAGPNAPTEPPLGPFSPQPGDTGARFVLEFDNPAGSGNPGGQTMQITAALNTRAP